MSDAAQGPYQPSGGAAAPGRNRTRATPVALVAAGLAGVGALVCGAINLGLNLANIAFFPGRVLFGSPVWFPYRVQPLGLVATLLALVVLAIVVAVVVWLGARASKGPAAVFFSTWFALVAGGWLAGLAGAPALAGMLRYPSEQLAQYIFQLGGSGGSWGLYWGWLTAAVATVVFMIINRPSAPERRS